MTPDHEVLAVVGATGFVVVAICLGRLRDQWSSDGWVIGAGLGATVAAICAAKLLVAALLS